MGNIALQVERTLSGNIDHGNNVIFELVKYSTGNISYDNTTGTITFMEVGRYVVNWFVVTQSSSYAEGVVLSFSSSNGDYVTGNSGTKTGEVVGIGIIEVTTVPITFSLKNISTGDYYYSENVPLKASLIITRDDLVQPVGMRCLAVDQLINILSQMITAYSTTTWTVYTESFYSYSGIPLELYTAPSAEKPGLLRLIDANNDYETIPIEHITAIYPGDGTLYDPGFTYLNTPNPLSHDCDSDLITAVQSYLPVGTTVEMGLGPVVSASGDVYRNEYGVVVLSDAGGNTPIFIASLKILRIFVIGNASKRKNANKRKKPEIRIIKK